MYFVFCNMEKIVSDFHGLFKDCVLFGCVCMSVCLSTLSSIIYRTIVINVHVCICSCVHIHVHVCLSVSLSACLVSSTEP